MQAVTAGDRAAGVAGLSLSDIAHPHAAENDVIVRVYAAGFTPGELDWPRTWTDRAGHDRAPGVPGHELSGVVTELGYGTTGLTVGQRVFGLAARHELPRPGQRPSPPGKVPARGALSAELPRGREALLAGRRSAAPASVPRSRGVRYWSHACHPEPA